MGRTASKDGACDRSRRCRPGQRRDLKAIGPILVGGKDLSPSTGAVIALLAPALLTALVVTETFGEGGHLVLDEKAVGVGVAALALALRAPVLLAVALAALTTTLVRAFA